MLIRCRQADLALVEEVLAPAAEKYKEATGKEVNLKIDQEAFLPASMLVILSA